MTARRFTCFQLPAAIGYWYGGGNALDKNKNTKAFTGKTLYYPVAILLYFFVLFLSTAYLVDASFNRFYIFVLEAGRILAYYHKLISLMLLGFYWVVLFICFAA